MSNEPNLDRDLSSPLPPELDQRLAQVSAEVAQLQREIMQKVDAPIHEGYQLVQELDGTIAKHLTALERQPKAAYRSASKAITDYIDDKTNIVQQSISGFAPIDGQPIINDAVPADDSTPIDIRTDIVQDVRPPDHGIGYDTGLCGTIPTDPLPPFCVWYCDQMRHQWVAIDTRTQEPCADVVQPADCHVTGWYVQCNQSGQKSLSHFGSPSIYSSEPLLTVGQR